MTEQTGGRVSGFWQLFADDEHTAADGAYVRAMRSRKWILLSAGLLAAVSLGFFNAAAFERLVRVFSFPSEHMFHIALAGTVYLYAQYLFLLAQLFTVYADLLRERLFQKQIDEVSAATDAHAQVQSDLTAVQLFLANAPADANGRGGEEKSERDLQRALDKAAQRLTALEAADPRRNQAFTILEVAIDTLRLLPPLVIGAAAIYAALSSPLGHAFWADMAAIGRPPPPVENQ